MLYTLLIVVQFSMTVRLSVFEFPLNSGFAIISHDLPFVNTFFQSFLQIFSGLSKVFIMLFSVASFSQRPRYITTLSPPCQALFLKFFEFFSKSLKAPISICICHASIHFVFTKMSAAIEILTDLCYNMCVDNLQKHVNGSGKPNMPLMHR